MEDDGDSGFDKEQVDALKFGLELNMKQQNEANEYLKNYRERLEEENSFLRDENDKLYSELVKLNYALIILRGE